MSNGLLSGGGGFGGWDTTQIDKTNNNDNNNQHNTIDSLFDNEYNGNHQRSSSSSSAKLKPYKQQQHASPADIDSNPFLSSAMNTESRNNRNGTDNDYINPFIDFASSNEPPIHQNQSQSQSEPHSLSQSQHHQHPQTSHQSKQPSMNAIQENQTIDAEVLDLLFDTNPTNTNSTQNNSNNANDAFYAFDFGVNNNDNNDKPKSNGRPKQKILSDEDDDSSSEEEEEDDESSEDEDEEEDEGEDSNDHDHDDNDNNNNHKGEDNQYSSNDLKLSPPKQQTKRSKKRRQSLIEENEKAFNKLHNQFDPSLVGTFPINKNESKSQQQKAMKAKQQKKRNTEPINIHSKRVKQLEKEGLIQSPKKMQSPNIGKSLRNKSNQNKNMNDDEKKENKNKNKKPKTKSKYNVLPELHRGTALLKYGRRGYPHFRQFNLTADNENLRWFSSKKKLQQSSINVGDINEILTGQHTKEFRRIAWTTLTPASFSVIYDNKKKSLNLVAKSVDEMKMWVEALRALRDLKRKGEVQLSSMDKLMVEVDFRDRNRPQSRNHSGNFIRSHETKEREVDPILQRKLIDDIAAIRKQFNEIAREANNPIIQSTKEYESIEQILSELEERVEELDHEVRNTRNTKIAENDVWRTRIDLESLREKIKVITKQNKQNYKASKRRWSVF